MKGKMSKLFKTMLCMLLCVTMVTSLAACSNGANETTEETSAGENTTEAPTEELHTDYVFEEKAELSELVLQEAESCFKYMWELAQTDESTGAYG